MKQATTGSPKFRKRQLSFEPKCRAMATRTPLRPQL